MSLQFGTFTAPFHSSVGHHSCGHELILEPMLFIAHAACHTRTIRLGAGVVSLPYHDPG